MSGNKAINYDMRDGEFDFRYISTATDKRSFSENNNSRNLMSNSGQGT